ncbi:hypothetical protein MJA45_11910 [Paenibacillus aurantius]|uniref:Uncharacterized protein n=1 Tax=Paenibacillus aurantius TaxID=2918900 RepID=A0AA96LKD2_9BACL|nr:hypothetical protein [Paenibacillus aurantius]WNQ13685.1 hypothetical protein MJA45_11910 [Paenibacillus aurantius]
MAQVLDVNLDIEEMKVQVENGKTASSQTIAYESIQKIQFNREKVKKWFGSKTVESIRIYTKQSEEPLVLRSDKLKSSFSAAESYLRKVALKNHVIVETHNE